MCTSRCGHVELLTRDAVEQCVGVPNAPTFVEQMTKRRKSLLRLHVVKILQREGCVCAVGECVRCYEREVESCV